jgi:hypothetical protein
VSIVESRREMGVFSSQPTSSYEDLGLRTIIFKRRRAKEKEEALLSQTQT